MIIRQRYVIRIVIFPPKDNPPLIINANAVMTGQITFHRLQVIARRFTQIFQSIGSV